MEPAPETGHRLALLVAASAYNDPDLRQLRAPGHDATELAEVLRDPRIGGFDVQVLINPASGEVHEGIEDFCTDRHPDDQLLIYLSCHGVLDSYGRLYYAATNTRRERLAATAVAAAWLNERLEDCRARRQILLLDCCHSGAFAKGAKGDVGLALQHRFEPHGRGRVVLTASRSTEYSFEGGQATGEGVPSVFTHAIVNGLRTGDADRDKDGLITVTDLYQYVYDSVRAAEPRQTPELWTYGAEGNLLVAHSVRGAVIEPEPLPEDLRMTLESPRRRVRETGVAELADLLDAAGPALSLTARQALERIAEEDHPQVAGLARIAVQAPAGAAADEVRRQLTERAHREERARQEATRREAEKERDNWQVLEQARRQAEGPANHRAETEEPQARREDTRRRADQEQEPAASPDALSLRTHAPAPTDGRTRRQEYQTQAGQNQAQPTFRATSQDRQILNWDLSRPQRIFLLTGVTSVVFFIASLTGYQFTSPRTQVQVMVGWFIGLSFTGAVLSSGLILRDRHIRRAMRATAEPYLKPGETVQVVFGAYVSPAWPLLNLSYHHRIFVVTPQRIFILTAGLRRGEARKIVAELSRSTRLGPPSGLWHVIPADGERLRVSRGFFRDIEAADSATISA
jgi:hypothetical protein